MQFSELGTDHEWASMQADRILQFVVDLAEVRFNIKIGQNEGIVLCLVSLAHIALFTVEDFKSYTKNVADCDNLCWYTTKVYMLKNGFGRRF